MEQFGDENDQYNEQSTNSPDREDLAEVDWIALLRQAFVDERAAPDVLEYKMDIMKAVTELVDKQTTRVAGMKSNADLELERIVYERDMQRTLWLIKAYHRTRIQKLEKNAQYYLHHKDYTSRLSSAELEYVKNYFVSIGRHATLLVLDHLPQPYKSFVQSSAMADSADMVPEPHFMSNIMFKPTYGHMTFSPPDGPSLELRASDSVVTPYEHVKHLLLAEEIRLV